MVDTGAGVNNIFRWVEKIHIADIHHQAHAYFGLIGIGNVGNQVLTNPLVISASTKLIQKCTGSKQFIWQGAIRYDRRAD